jgi:hypothetical protein
MLSNDEFNRIIKLTLYAYDVLLDFDRPKDINNQNNIDNEFLDEFIKFKQVLTSENVKFHWNESKTGYHITIPYETILLPFDLAPESDDVLLLYRDLVLRIKEVFKLKYLCLANAGVINRLQLCPYTICNNEKIIIPEFINNLSTDKEFKLFYNKFLR